MTDSATNKHPLSDKLETIATNETYGLYILAMDNTPLKYFNCLRFRFIVVIVET